MGPTSDPCTPSIPFNRWFLCFSLGLLLSSCVNVDVVLEVRISGVGGDVLVRWGPWHNRADGAISCCDRRTHRSQSRSSTRWPSWEHVVSRRNLGHFLGQLSERPCGDCPDAGRARLPLPPLLRWPGRHPAATRPLRVPVSSQPLLQPTSISMSFSPSRCSVLLQRPAGTILARSTRTRLLRKAWSIQQSAISQSTSYVSIHHPL